MLAKVSNDPTPKGLHRFAELSVTTHGFASEIALMFAVSDTVILVLVLFCELEAIPRSAIY
jgi:hypothetical protein